MKIIKTTIMEFKNGNDIVHVETDLPSTREHYPKFYKTVQKSK